MTTTGDLDPTPIAKAPFRATSNTVEIVTNQFINVFGERSVPIVLVSLGISFALLTVALKVELGPQQWSQIDFVALLVFGSVLVAFGCLERLVHPVPIPVRDTGPIKLGSISPSVAKPGEVVRVDGGNFGNVPKNRAVLLNGTEVRDTLLAWSDSSITFTVPTLAPGGQSWRPGERVDVQVVANGRSSSDRLSLQIGVRDQP